MASDPGVLEYFICGGFGGICTLLIGHPFDTIKVRLQTLPTYRRGFLDCLHRTVKNEGIGALYKGLSAPLVGVVPIFAICFSGYRVGKDIFFPIEPEKVGLRHYFVAGAFSGVFATFIMAPGERIKCLMQVQEVKVYKGSLDCAQKLYNEGGIRCLYRGSLATLLRDIPSSGAYFVTYEAFKNYFTRNTTQRLNVFQTVLSGGLAGVAYWFVGMPFDVVKSVQQTSPLGRNGFIEVSRDLVRREGVLAFYKGLVPVLLRAFPANAACFLGFEFARSTFQTIYPTPTKSQM